MTASLMLLGLGLKLRRRWSGDVWCVEWGLGVCEDEGAVGACGARIWDSSSMVVGGSMVVYGVLVVCVLEFVDEDVAGCLCQRGSKTKQLQRKEMWVCW